MRRMLSLLAMLMLLLPGGLSAQVEINPGESITIVAKDSVRVEIDSILVHDTTVIHDTTVVVDSVPYFECPADWTCTPPEPPPDTTPPPPDTTYTQAPSNLRHRPEFSRALGGIRATWGGADRARQYRIERARSVSMTHPDTTIILPLIDGDWMCVWAENEVGESSGNRCNTFREANLPPLPPDTTAFYWPSGPVAPDSIAVTVLDCNRCVRVDWFGPTFGGEGTGWIVHSEKIGGGDEYTYVGQMRLRSAGIRVRQRGDHRVCVTALFDSTQEPYDAYTVGVIYPDRILPDTTVAERATPTCKDFFWHGYAVHAETQIGDTGFVAGHTSHFTLEQSGQEAWTPAPDSVVFNVDGNRVVERLTPYAFPGDTDTYIVPDEPMIDLEWEVFGSQPAAGSQSWEVEQP